MDREAFGTVGVNPTDQVFADTLHRQGIAAERNKENLEAIQLFKKEFELRKGAEPTLAQGLALKSLSRNYMKIRDFRNALKYSIDGLALWTGLDNGKELGLCLIMLGNIHKENRDYSTAIHHFHRSRATFERLDDFRGLVIVNEYLGEVHALEHNLDSALLYQEMALDVATKHDLARAQLECYLTLHNIYLELKEFGKAREALLAGLPLLKRKHMKVHAPRYYLGLGNVSLAENLPDSALKYFLMAKQTASHTDREGHFAKAKLGLGQGYAAKGQYRMAFNQMQSGLQHMQADFKRQIEAQHAYLSDSYTIHEAEMKEKAQSENLASLEVENEQQENRLILVLALLLVAFPLAMLLFYLLRRQRRLSIQLARQNVTITEALATREMLMDEIHHRVKNNLQSVSSLLKLQSHYVKNLDAREAILEGRNRVHAMGMIHKRLYGGNAATSLAIDNYLEELVEHLENSYRDRAGKVEIDLKAKPANLDVDQAIYLGLILNEIITNAYKHAFPDEREGTIKVELEAKENAFLQVTVDDNGVGLPSDFDPEKSNSFGMELVSIFSKKLNSKPIFSNGKGTLFSLYFEKKPFKTYS